MVRASAQILGVLRPEVEGLGYELLGIEHIQGKRDSLLRLYIDHEEGIGVDDCEAVSRQVSAVLDVEDPIGGEYTLEVSSPGLDRPLFEIAHFEQFAGEEVKIRLRHPVEGRRNFTGTIGPCGTDSVTLIWEGGEISFPLDSIGTARLVPSF